MTILVAILAAGRSRRFAGDKIMADCAGRPLGEWALLAATGLGADLVWIGASEPPPFLADAPTCEFVANPEAGEGIAASIRLAARRAQARKAEGLLLMLADMPLVGSAHLEQLLRTMPPCATGYLGGRPGVPALFPASFYPDLLRLTGDFGASGLLGGIAGLGLVAIGDEDLLDVDSPSDLLRAAQALRSRI